MRYQHLTILCEGETEERVLKDFLKPYCAGFDGVRVVTTGGANKLKSAFKDLAEMTLEADTDAVIFCLIDVYQAPFSPYPKPVEEHPNPPLARYSYIQRYMQEKIAPSLRERFFAFPVLMEIETWLLADVDALNDYFSPPAQQRLKARSTPESVEHPAEELKRLMLRFKKREYRKTKDGQLLFRRASAKRVYDDECPHFEAMINKLLELQGWSPEKPTPPFQIPDQELYEELSKQFADWERQKADLQRQQDELWKAIELEFEKDEPDDARLISLENRLREIDVQKKALTDN